VSYTKKKKFNLLRDYKTCKTTGEKAILLDNLFKQSKQNEIRKKTRIKERYDNATCLSCGTDDLDILMLSDEMWRKINPEIAGWLCLNCVEKRLGRPLHARDLKTFEYKQKSLAILKKAL